MDFHSAIFFLLHANIKTAFTDYDNHPETDFYELKKNQVPHSQL